MRGDFPQKKHDFSIIFNPRKAATFALFLPLPGRFLLLHVGSGQFLDGNRPSVSEDNPCSLQICCLAFLIFNLVY